MTPILVHRFSSCDACGSAVHDADEMLCRWCKGKGANPVPFGSERARRLWDARTADRSDVMAEMSYGEIGYVFAVWKTMHSGSCWQDAFFAILNGEHIEFGSAGTVFTTRYADGAED